MKEKYNGLISLVPASVDLTIDWDRIMQSGLAPWLHRMAETPQNLEWHGEGDVLAHTKMVCESLINSADWQDLDRRSQEVLFIAALLHDIGKITCTRMEDGVPVSPYHTAIGDKAVRTLLWRDLKMSGTYEAQQFRETVCALIRRHSVPFRFFDETSPERRAVQLASIGDLAPGFSNKLLAILAEADIKGRIAGDISERLEHVSFFREISKEAECLENPVTFPSTFSRYAYLSGRNIVLGQDLYDDTWGTVILLAGLPGTGKDSYINAHYPDLPMVSLDAIRKEMSISPSGPQGGIISAAQKRAKEYLRKKQPFVWNATNITPDIRQKQIRLFTGYKAAVKIVFLETAWEETLHRNQNRLEAVPESVINHMLEKLVMPNMSETHEAEWILV